MQNVVNAPLMHLKVAFSCVRSPKTDPKSQGKLTNEPQKAECLGESCQLVPCLLAHLLVMKFTGGVGEDSESGESRSIRDRIWNMSKVSP